MDIVCPKFKTVVWTSKSGPSGVSSRLMSDYKEVEFLGAGGYGCVVKVWSRIDEQYYAIKKIKLNDVNIDYEYVVREARAMANLSHPNVVRYHTAWLETNILGMVSIDLDDENPEALDEDYGIIVANGTEEAGSMLCIQQELCHGSLKDVMKALTNEKIREIFQQLVNGICYIHSKDIVHGDLSPSNIFLDESKEVVKIGDFGLATLGDEEHIRPPTRYCAPELDDTCKFSKGSDIYSLALILLDMLARFSNDGERVRELKKFQDEYAWPPSSKGASEVTKTLVRNMTSKNPDLRPTASYILANHDFHQ